MPILQLTSIKSLIKSRQNTCGIMLIVVTKGSNVLTVQKLSASVMLLVPMCEYNIGRQATNQPIHKCTISWRSDETVGSTWSFGWMSASHEINHTAYKQIGYGRFGFHLLVTQIWGTSFQSSHQAALLLHVPKCFRHKLAGRFSWSLAYCYSTIKWATNSQSTT